MAQPNLVTDLLAQLEAYAHRQNPPQDARQTWHRQPERPERHRQKQSSHEPRHKHEKPSPFNTAYGGDRGFSLEDYAHQELSEPAKANEAYKPDEAYSPSRPAFPQPEPEEDPYGSPPFWPTESPPAIRVKEFEGIPWSLAPAKLLECVEPKLRIRHTSRLLDIAQTFAQANDGVLLLDASLLRFAPAFALTESFGQNTVQIIQDQLALFPGLSDKYPGASCPLARFSPQAFKPGGFCGGSRQGGIAAVPVQFVRSCDRELVVRCFDFTPSWNARRVRKVFLQQLATFCRALSPEDVPTLSLAAMARLREPGAICLSKRHKSQHPVLLVFQDAHSLEKIMREIASFIRENHQSLSRFLETCCVPRTPEVITEESYHAWASGGSLELFADCWPVDLETLELWEIKIALSSQSSGTNKLPYRDRGRDRGQDRAFSRHKKQRFS